MILLTLVAQNNLSNLKAKIFIIKGIWQRNSVHCEKEFSIHVFEGYVRSCQKHLEKGNFQLKNV